MAKIAPLDRTAVGCKRPHWVLLKAHQERLGAPEPLGYTGDTVEYLLRTAGINNSVHYWVNGDTACKMWSSNGITKKHKFSIVSDPMGHFLCGLCHQAMPMPDAPERRPSKTAEQKKLKAQRKAANKERNKKGFQAKKPNLRPRQIYYGDVQSSDFLQSYEWRRVRMEALKKYGRTCQCCGASPATGAVMNVDHIKPRRIFPQLALDLDNLQVLCHECNHGKGNWDMTDWRPDELTDADRENIAHLKSI